MKKAAIITLVALNVGLLTWLLARNVSNAYGESYFAPADYLVVAGKHNGTSQEAVYVLDVQQRKLQAWYMDKTSKRMVMARGACNLVKDFDRKDLTSRKN